LPISYERRRENAVGKAVDLLKPAVSKYMSSPESAALSPSAADSIIQTIRKHFFGFRGAKNEKIEGLRLSSAEIDRAIWAVLRELVKQPELAVKLKQKNKERKHEMAKGNINPWAPDVDRMLKPIRRFRALKSRKSLPEFPRARSEGAI
jgi:hypothetical protein